MAVEPEKVDIRLRQELDLGRRAWLVAKLESENGIVSAWFDGDDHRHLTVHYEPAHFSHETLLDTLRLLGCPGDIDKV